MHRFEIISEDGATTVVLGDDAISTPRNIIIAPPWLPEESREVQTASPVRAQRKKVWGRGNRSVAFTWYVSRKHDTIAQASAFKRSHAEEIPALGVCTLRITEEGTQSVSKGAIESVRCTEHLGVRTVFEYSWMGTGLTSS